MDDTHYSYGDASCSRTIVHPCGSVDLFIKSSTSISVSPRLPPPFDNIPIPVIVIWLGEGKINLLLLRKIGRLPSLYCRRFNETNKHWMPKDPTHDASTHRHSLAPNRDKVNIIWQLCWIRAKSHRLLTPYAVCVYTVRDVALLLLLPKCQHKLWYTKIWKYLFRYFRFHFLCTHRNQSTSYVVSVAGAEQIRKRSRRTEKPFNGYRVYFINGKFCRIRCEKATN